MFRSIADLFEHQAEVHPDRPAFLHDKQSLSFKQLNARANQIARCIQDHGLKPDSPVAICLNPGLDFAAAVFGVIKSGHPYLLFSPRTPQQRAAHMLLEADVGFAISKSVSFKFFEGFRGELLNLDIQSGFISQKTQSNVTRDPNNTSSALYVCFTSGSTGTPKGILIPQRQMLMGMAWRWDRFPFEAGEMTCHKTNLSFVDANYEIFEAVLKGMPTLFLSESTVKDPLKLVEALATHKVTRIRMVPTYLRLLLDSIPDLDRKLPDVWMWTISGEALSGAVVEKFHRAMKDRTLFNVYGLTEVFSVAAYEASGSDAYAARVPVGKPIPGRELYVLDHTLKPVPPGTQGIVYVGGRDLPEGYLNPEEAPSLKWLNNPYEAETGNKILFNTGDLGVMSDDGDLDIVGRNDAQIKINGQRVDPEEIERSLEQHPQIEQAVVLTEGAGSEQKLLSAFVKAVNGSEMEIPTLKGFLESLLPAYMVPQRYLQVEAFPLTISGKLDRLALIEQCSVQKSAGPGENESLTDTESALVAKIRAMLSLNRMSRNDDLFDLGLDSVRAMQLVLWIMEQPFGRELHMTDLLLNPTVAQLARFLGGNQTCGAAEADSALNA